MKKKTLDYRCAYCNKGFGTVRGRNIHISRMHRFSKLTRDIDLSSTVTGVGPDAPTVVSENGAKQSKVDYRFDLIDAKALFAMAKVLDEGARKYGEENWRGIPIREHLNHLLIHAYAYLAGDHSDDHLSHILCRATFAQAVALAETEE